MPDTALAVDLGGTNIRAALISRDGEIQLHSRVATAARQGVYAVVDQIVAMVEAAVETGDVSPDVGVGVVAPGPLEPATGIVRFAPNLPGWDNVPLARLLIDRLQRPVYLGNDGNCAALGEAMFGAGRNVANLLYLALGTGLGAGIIHRGQLIEGALGLGGEVGHVSINQNGPRCTCGGIGCIEAYVGGWAIARQGELALHSERSEIIRELAADGPVTAELVSQAASMGDPVSHQIFARAGQALAVGVGGLVNVFNPELIIIGGGLAQAGELILEPFRATLPQYTMRPLYAHVSIVPSSLGQDTGIYGAAASVFYLAQG
jgi:glucokinase